MTPPVPRGAGAGIDGGDDAVRARHRAEVLAAAPGASDTPGEDRMSNAQSLSNIGVIAFHMRLN
jgi:hypothetical protein